MAGEGEKMVMDLQDVNQTLGDGIAASEIRLFGSSSAPLTVPTASGSGTTSSSPTKRDRRAAFNDAVGEHDDEDDDDDLESDTDGAEMREEDFESASDDEADDNDQDDRDEEVEVDGARDARGRRRAETTNPSSVAAGGLRTETIAYADSDSDLGFSDPENAADDESGEDDDEDGPEWKKNLAGRAAENLRTTRRKQNLCVSFPFS